MNAELMQKEVVRELPFEDMMKLFETLTFREKWAKVRYGLKQPRESGEYKWAALQIRRLISPLSAVAVPALGLLLMVTLAGMKPLPKPLPTIRITDQAPPPDLIDPVLPPENPPPPDPERIVDPSADFMPSPGKTQAGPNTDFSPQTAPLTAVAMIRSKVVMRGILRARRPGVRGDLLKKGGGGSHTERAVMLALRWLKQNQAADGSWLGGTEQLNDSKVKAAMTGLALLTYLAHDEKTDSPEFGETVAKAIKWLLDNQVAGGGWNRSYQHPIATYALCEAYAMTRIPDVREAAERGLDILIAGQNPDGGWRYRLDPALDNNVSDSSVMSWCTQALKAGQIAELNRPGLEEAMARAIRGWQGNFQGVSHAGHFQYNRRDPRFPGLTGAGVLSLQLLGASETDAARAGMQYLLEKRNTFQWEGAKWQDVYYWYYDTQARFQAGGASWDDWNSKFSNALVAAQKVVHKAMADPNGQMVDVGYWCTGNHRGGRVMDTTLSALQLMVYYRYLPTFRKVEEVLAAEGNPPQGVAAPDLDMNMRL